MDRYQTFQRRFVAPMVDQLVLLPLSTVISLVAYLAFDDVRDYVLSIIIASAVLGTLYTVLFTARWGQTPGKMAAGIRIVQLDEQRAPGLLRAVLRESPNIVLSLLAIRFLWGINDRPGQTIDEEDFSLFFGLMLLAFGWLALELVTMLSNNRRRALHDYIAGTVVVKTYYQDQPWPKTAPDFIPVPSTNPDYPSFTVANPKYLVGWRRFFAALIDRAMSLLLLIPATGIAVAADWGPRGALAATGVAFLGYAVYDVVCHATAGQTLGKVFLGIRVVHFETMATPSWRASAIRAVELWFDAGVLFAWLTVGETSDNDLDIQVVNGSLALLFCMWITPQRRSFHDLLAGTTVIRAESPTSYVPGHFEAPPKPVGW